MDRVNQKTNFYILVMHATILAVIFYRSCVYHMRQHGKAPFRNHTKRHLGQSLHTVDADRLCFFFL